MHRSIESEDFVDLAICCPSSSVDVRALRVEALVRVGGVVDNLELAVAVEEAVATLHVPLVVLLLVPELSVVSERRLRMDRCVGRRLRELSPSDRTQPNTNLLS